MKKSIRLSIPAVHKVRGYQIKRASLGELLGALETLRTAPGELMAKLFPDMGITEVLGELKALDNERLSLLLIRALTVVPAMAAGLVSELCGIPEEELMDDPAIGADGLLEMIEAWMEVNGVENFIHAASRLWQKGRVLAAKGGSNG